MRVVATMGLPTGLPNVRDRHDVIDYIEANGFGGASR
jgi:hypothetical protein